MGTYITNARRAGARLPVIAAWLRQVSELVNGAGFDLDIYSAWEYSEQNPKPPRNVREASACGFEGCALGWARLCPTLRRRGLRLAGDPGYFFSEVIDAAEFFGITEVAARTIFGTRDFDWQDGGRVEYAALDNHDPIAAAERVERFCRDNGVPL